MENRRLQALLPQFYGRYLMQLGEVPLQSLATSPIPHKILVTNKAGNQVKLDLVVHTAYAALPLPDDSVDVVILPHILEFEAQPKVILSEVWRVLGANATLLILGFNPWSFWGLYRLLCPRKSPLWNAHFYSSQTICHWIRALSGEINGLESFFFRPPVQCLDWLNNLKWMERVFPWISPHSGGIYLIIAQKKLYNLTPLPLSQRLQLAGKKVQPCLPVSKVLLPGKF